MSQEWLLSVHERVSEKLTQGRQKDERMRSGSCRDQSKRRTSIGRTPRFSVGLQATKENGAVLEPFVTTHESVQTVEVLEFGSWNRTGLEISMYFQVEVR